APDAEVIAERESAEILTRTDPDGGAGTEGPVLERERVIPLAAGESHRFAPVGPHPALQIRAVGGRHAIIHPDIPRVGNCGIVLAAEDGPRLGITGDSLEPVSEFHGIDALAFAVVAPWSKMSETIDFLRAVGPRLALPVHDGV